MAVISDLGMFHKDLNGNILNLDFHHLCFRPPPLSSLRMRRGRPSAPGDLTVPFRAVALGVPTCQEVSSRPDTTMPKCVLEKLRRSSSETSSGYGSITEQYGGRPDWTIYTAAGRGWM